ncbi:MAG: TIR domain-containing protein, partial [Cyanobacteriota bacterium]
MNRIFISHSSKDALQAEQILGWLKADQIEAFLDSDLEFGIKAGADWNEELRIRLEECSILIPVCSRNFRDSDWCRYEVDVAYHRSIDIIPILIDESEPISILQRFQTITLSKDSEEARQRLLAGIKRILDSDDPVHWDPQRRPYPGLDPFLEADEAIFFGRQREINEGIQMLRTLRREKEAALMMVIGASGSGKSSLVRAGILPRIKRDPEEWIVLDPFRPGQEPFRELATCLASLFESLGKTLNRSDVMAQLQRSPIETLSEMGTDLRMLTKKKEATLLICIDQFEEVLETTPSGAGPTTSSQRKAFLEALKTVINSQVYREKLLIVGTLRSDFLDAFQSQGMKYKEYILRPLEEENFRQVLVEPARIIGLKIEPELVDMMINDTQTGDALPLLAFTLRELWERKREDKPVGLRSAVLKQSDYLEIGRLEGAIQKRAEDLFPQNCSTSAEGKYRDAFLRMIRSNADMDHSGWVKQAATWEEMPPESLETLDRFVTARLLVKKTHDDKILIEPAHEALLRNWARLRQWIKEENDFLLWRDRFLSDFLQWRDSTARSKEYLTGAKLIEAERWKDKFLLASQERIFIEKSIQHRKRNKQLKISAVLTLIAFLLASLNLWQNAEEAQAEQLKIRQLTTINTDPYESGIAGLAAMGRFFLRPGLNYQIARGLDMVLAKNLARAEKLATSLSRIDAITQLSDNQLVAAGIQRLEAYLLWITINDDGVMSESSKPEASKQTTIRQLLPSNDGKTIHSLGYSDSQILLTSWPKKEQREIFKSLQIDRQTLAFIPGPDLIIAAYGESDGMLYLWSDGTDVQKVAGVPRTKAFTPLADGTIVSAHENGPLRKWQIIRRDGKIQVNSIGTLNSSENKATIVSLTSFVSNGKTIIVAGGEDGSLRLWLDGKEIQHIPPQVSGQDQILSLAALPAGDVVSGDSQSLVRWWKWDQTMGNGGMLRPLTEQPFATGQEAINRLTVLAGTKQANRGVISTGTDGSLRLLSSPPRSFTNPWPHSAEATKATFTALTELGRADVVASAHANGSICWWNIPTSWQSLDAPECKRLPDPSRVKALVDLPREGQLISAGSNGNQGMLLAWSKGRKDSLLTTTGGTPPVSP